MCAAANLGPGTAYSQLLGNHPTGMPLMAMVVRDLDGRLHAYRNLCRHLAIPLDGGTGELVNKKGTHLICGTHGAQYRFEDGYCTTGPCEGLSLFRLPWKEEDGFVYVRPEPSNM